MRIEYRSLQKLDISIKLKWYRNSELRNRWRWLYVPASAAQRILHLRLFNRFHFTIRSHAEFIILI